MAKSSELVANEFKNGKWINSFPVESLDDFREIVRVSIKYTGELSADVFNCETRGGTVVEVIRVPRQC